MLQPLTFDLPDHYVGNVTKQVMGEWQAFITVNDHPNWTKFDIMGEQLIFNVREIEPGIYESDLNFGVDIDIFTPFQIVDDYNRLSKDGIPVRYDNRDLSGFNDYWESTIEQYGVADNVEQIKAQYQSQIESPNPIVISICEMRKEDQEERGGWRWHKWGQYIGTQEPQCEYLYDEPNIDSVYIFHVYAVKPKEIKVKMNNKTNKTNRLIMFSGAGISAESGIPTFRDVGGLWEQYDVNAVCTMSAFLASKKNPQAREMIFDFYNKVKDGVRPARPNPAHEIVAEWQKRYGDRVVIITANVDDLFEKAGCQNVVHVHGTLTGMQCHACDHRWDIGDQDFDPTTRCPKCDSRATKPNVVFFGENAPEYATMRYHYHEKRMQPDDIVMYCGSSMSVIPPTALLPPPYHTISQTRVLVNLDTNFLDSMFNHHYYGKASEQLPMVDEKIVIPQME